MDDTQIIALYFSRSEASIAETAQKYGPYLNQISYNILGSAQDAEEIVTDTYFAAWNTIPPQRPAQFFAFLAKLCRNLACNKLDWLRADKRRAELTPLTEELAQCIPDKKTDRERDARELGVALNGFLSTLPQETRVIFMRRYWYCDSIQGIAGRFNISQSKVKTQLHRTRNKLKQFLEKEGICV